MRRGTRGGARSADHCARTSRTARWSWRAFPRTALGMAIGIVVWMLPMLLSAPMLLFAIDTDIVAGIAAPCRGQAGPLRAQDEFWWASTRGLPSSVAGNSAITHSTASSSSGPLTATQANTQDGAQAGVQVEGQLDAAATTVSALAAISWKRWSAESGWVDASLEEFLRGADRGINTIYVHGNRIANTEAERRARQVYQLLVDAADDEPIRMLAWSWPSDKLPGPRLDLRVKAERTYAESVYLGSLLAQFRPDDRVSLVGYSYGARTISGALHLAAGGTIDGATLPIANTPRMRAVLLASATPAHWLLPDSFHERAVEIVDQMLILYNSQDAALRHFHLVEPWERPRALGYRGLSDATLAQHPFDERVRQRDVFREIGMAHDELRYYASPRIIDEIRRYALFGPANSAER